jgi:hypothetical protein
MTPMETKYVLLARLFGVEASALELVDSSSEKGLLSLLEEEGILSRVVMRAIRLCLEERYDESDLKQLISVNTSRIGVRRIIERFHPTNTVTSEQVATTKQPASLLAAKQPDPVEQTKTKRLPQPPVMTKQPPSTSVRVVRPEDSIPRVGGTLGRCLLVEQLGQGGVGLVFRAFHQGLGIPVAVKVLRRDHLDDSPEAYAQLRNEARLLAMIDHPNVVRVLDFEDCPHHPYAVLECVEGPSLAELIQQSSSIRPMRALEIIRQTAEALAEACRHGIVHRDLKPGNILLTREGQVKLADLGLAIKKVDPAKSETGNSTVDVVGTVAYMAPEQFLSPGKVNLRSDIYALGATLYHCLTGTVPFTGPSVMAVTMKHLNETPIPPHERFPEIPKNISALVGKMMEKDQSKRFQNYPELISAIDAILHR